MFALLQLTDCHLGAPWQRDSAAALEAVLAAVAGILPGAPDAVLVTGDIAHTGAQAEYAQARSLLARAGAPLIVVPGNHDDRSALRAGLGLPDSGRPDLSSVHELGALRVIALDTQRPGADGGQFDPERREWLDQTLASDRLTPTLLAMHHPPITTGLPALDAIGIPAPERAALGEVLARHPQVVLIVAGHVHRTIRSQLGATPVLVVPSTNLQLALDLEAPEVVLVPEVPSFALHLLIDGELVSHVGTAPT